MSTSQDLTNVDLFALGKQTFRQLIRDFGDYGIQANPKMELKPGKGMLCYYDLNDGNIYLSVPDLTQPVGKLHLLFLRSIIGCDTDDEILYFFNLFIPHVIAHEMAHHYRSRYGFFSSNLWEEEQVANQLAIAVTKSKFSPDQLDQARHFLEDAIKHLENQLKVHDIAVDSHYNIWESLNATGQFEDSAIRQMELAHELFSIDPSEVLRSSGQLSPEIMERFERRDNIIEEVNEEYASDYMRYMYYQLSWMLLDLISLDRQYIEAFARRHLNINIPMLPVLASDPDNIPSSESILACFKAYQDTAPLSATSSQYFYKRYRALLLKRLQSDESGLPGHRERLRQETNFLMENWDSNEEETDMLNYIANLAHPSLRKLFPQQIIDHIEGRFPIQVHLPTETDRRLWRHIVLQEYDQGAVNTLSRLTILSQIAIYRALPAEVMLELTHNFTRVKLREEEVIIWEGAHNFDVYILIKGRLEVYETDAGHIRQLGTIKPGEVFGEMAFFTRQPRNATVRAIEHSECFVLKDSDLHVFVFKYPSVLIQMARILTTRLEINQRVRNQDDD
ncbi:MAG TPA: cyclic nucleotide-binding domain-containing protein [Anaerolineae bacterium]|nr:cyclic nucleotide-binding domain-containing protein [Anaerolineae bacterium]